MKPKTIKKILRRKVDDWLNSVEDPVLRDEMRRGTIVTGGAIASMLLKEQVNDYDVYFTSLDLAEKVATYYLARFEPAHRQGIPFKIYVDRRPDRVSVVAKSVGVASEEGTEKDYEYFEGARDEHAEDYISDVMDDPEEIADAGEELKDNVKRKGKPKYRPVFISTNAITLSDKIQVTLRFAGSPDEIHGNYDFAHCMNYWRSDDGELVLRQAALESLLAKDLKYVGSKYPICSLIRVRKFVSRGWTINAGQILKMVWQVKDLDLQDIAVLQEQLTGVDAAYFSQLISRLKEKNPEQVDSAYLVEIIDRLF